MDIRDILCLQQGQDYPPKRTNKGLRHPSHHLSWKNARTWHMWKYTRPTCRSIITTSPRCFRRCASSCQPIMNNNQGFGMTWRTVPSWIRNITQRLKPPPMTYFFGYKNTVPQRQVHTPTRAGTFVHSNNADRINTVSGNNEISLEDFMWYLCQEMVSYALNCLLSTHNALAGS